MANLSNINNKFLVTTGGNVGIGTTSPGTKLVIEGTNDAAGTGVVEIKTTGTNLKIGGNTTYSWIQSHSSKPLYINQLGNNVILNLGIGNVGIGTASPGAKLHIDSTGNALKFTRTSQETYLFEHGTSGLYTKLGTTLLTGWTQDHDFKIYDNTASQYVMFDGSTQRVGIGDTSPSTKIDVYQSAVGIGAADFRHVNGNRILINPSYNYYDAYNHIFRGLSGTNTHMTIDLNGNVGIGTTAPAEILHTSTSGNNVGRFESTDATAYVQINDTADSFYLTTASQYGSIGGNASVHANNLNISLTTGNVGIGTTSPDLKLDVTHATAGEYVATFQNTGANLELKLGVTSTSYLNIQGQQINNSAAFNISLQADGGNVGIGTTTPNEKLQLAGNLNAYAPGGIDAGLFASTAAGSTTIALRSSGVTHFNGGNVGIGTTSPQRTLDVRGTGLNIFGSGGNTEIMLRGQVEGTGTVRNVGSWHWSIRGDVGGNNDDLKLLRFVTGSYAAIALQFDSSNSNATFAGEITSGDDINAGGKLVCANVASDKKIAFRRTGANNFSIEHDSSSLYFYNESTSELPIRFFNNGDVSMIAGNVGIGTTSPATQLDIGIGTLGNNGYGGIRIQDDAAHFWMLIVKNSVGDRRLSLYHGQGSIPLVLQEGGGNVGIGTTSPECKLHIVSTTTDNSKTLLLQNSSTGDASVMFNISGDTYSLGIDNDDGDKFKLSYGALGTNDRLVIDSSGNVGIGTTSPDSLLELDGAIGIGGASGDSNVSISTTAFTAQSAGCLHVNWGVAGTAANGSTIVFTYAATAWKSWTLKFNFASTNGMTQGVIGGYNNNNGGGSSVYDINALGCSAVATNSGQTVIVTFTFTALGIHPMMSFVYMQSGGDGQPRADRVSLQANNAV